MNPSVYGNSLMITATLTKGATGTVIFVDGTSMIGSSPINAGGSAAISTVDLNAGVHTITATYSGDLNFQ
jgi:hypothetical protein